jgi:hypothetical protein
MSATAMCTHNRSLRRSLVGASLCLLFASQAQALPFSLACLSKGSQAPSIECRLASDGRLSDGVDVLAPTGSSTVFGSVANLPPAFEFNAGDAQHIVFSLSIHTSGLEVIASTRNETLRAGMRESIPNHDASYELAGHDPVAPSAALVLIAGVSGMVPRPTLRIEAGAARDFVRHAGPLAAGSAVLQFNLLSDRAVASLVSVGAISALRYGQQIVIEPLGAIVLGWSTVIYPAIVRRAMTTTNELGASLARAVRAAVALSAPAALWMAAVAPLVVELVYLRGAFDAQDVAMTTAVVVAFSPMILLTAVQPVLTGAHNARRRAMLLGMVAFANAILNVTLNVLFAAVLGIGGIALSTSITVLILLLFLASRITEVGFSPSSILGYTLRAILASCVVVAPSLIVARSIPSGLGLMLAPILAILGIATALAYPLISRRFGVMEPMIVVRAAVDTVRRVRG